MRRDRGSLQHRPFLTPIWLTGLGIALSAFVLACAAWYWGTADSTTVVVIRGADVARGADARGGVSGSADQRGGAGLARLFDVAGAGGRLNAIYVSDAPAAGEIPGSVDALAAQLGLKVIPSTESPRSLVRRVLRDHGGQRILVIADAKTLIPLVDALSGGAHPDAIDEPTRTAGTGVQDTATLYVIAVPRIGRANVMRLAL